MSSIANLKLAMMQKFGRNLLVLRKFSPEILTGAGVIGVVASGVLLVRAGMKTNALVEEASENIGTVKEIHSDDLDEGLRTSSYNRDMTYAYLQAGKQFVKVYGPPIVLGAASVGAILGGHNILQRRNVALAAAYKALDSSYKEYKKRVSEEIGEESELGISRGERKEIVSEKGKGKKTIVTSHREGRSPFAVRFDNTSSNYDRMPDYNITFLRAQEAYWNQRLQAFGHVFLNEVYDALDLPRTKLGTQAGWVSDGEGDNYIDFNLAQILDRESNISRRYYDGVDNYIWLDFNVDGLIYDLI